METLKLHKWFFIKKSAPRKDGTHLISFIQTEEDGAKKKHLFKMVINGPKVLNGIIERLEEIKKEVGG